MQGFDLSIVWLLVKVVFLFVFGLYIVFATIVVKQAYLMTSTVQVGFEFPVKSLAWIHLFFAVGAFIFAFITL